MDKSNLMLKKGGNLKLSFFSVENIFGIFLFYMNSFQVSNLRISTLLKPFRIWQDYAIFASNFNCEKDRFNSTKNRFLIIYYFHGFFLKLIGKHVPTQVGFQFIQNPFPILLK